MQSVIVDMKDAETKQQHPKDCSDSTANTDPRNLTNKLDNQTTQREPTLVEPRQKHSQTAQFESTKALATVYQRFMPIR